MKTQCAWCKKFKQEDGSWKLESYSEPEDTFHRVSHDICPPCSASVKAGTYIKE